MKIMNNLDKSTYDEVVDTIKFRLMTVIDENKGGFTTDEYKVRTEYSVSKFYLNKVDGYDESISLLIHRIMYVEKLYEKFLSSEHMKVMEQNPDSSYFPIELDEDEMTNWGFSVLQEFLIVINYNCIHFVYQKLKEENIKKHIEVISLKEDFEDYLDPPSEYNGIFDKDLES